MSGEAHRVGSARFHISGPDHAALLQWRTRLEAVGPGELEQALDIALRDILPPDELLVIDRLEVDLGEFAADEFDLPRLTSATREALHRQAIHAIRRPDVPIQPPADSHAGAAEGHPAYRVRLSRSANAVLMTYLATGQLDRAAPFTDLAALYEALEITSATLEAFRHLLITGTMLMRRAALLRLYATAPRNVTQALMTGGFPDLPAAVRADDDLRSSGLEARPVDDKSQSSRLEQVIDDTLAKLDTEHPSSAVAEEPRTEKPEFQSLSGALPCANAGLVLLHPFLRPYFEGTGLMRDGVFAGSRERIIASRMLHFIATGETSHEEPDLVIPRLLCNVPDERPVLPIDGLDPEHLAEAQRMLVAAIDAWEGIGHATPDGIRETFLQRPGVLRGSSDALQLTIERSGIDILLDRLPWAVSLVKLPWMPAPLKVDWS